MTDDDPGTYTPLEDQTVDPLPAEAPPAAEPAAEAAPAEPETPPAEPDDDDDLEAQAVPDRLTNEPRIPLHAVAKLREKSRQLKAERETLSGKVKDLEVQAARAQELEGQLRQVQAWVQAQAGQPRQPDQPDPRQAQREQARQVRAELLAKTLDLYTPEGKPDLERGLRMLDLNEAMAKEQAEQMVQPLKRQTAESRAMSNRAAITTHLGKIGQPLDTVIFNQLWNHVGPELTSQQEVAAVIAAATLGWPMLFGTQAPAQVQQAIQQAQPKSHPLVTEPVQQRVIGAPRLTGLAARAAKDAGMTAEQVEKAYGQRSQSGTVVLADDTE